MATLFLMTDVLQAQESDNNVYDENYARAHIAYTDFSRLGLSPTSFTHCVKAVNFLEAGKVPGIVTINGEEFRDDGVNNDRIAHDGILTSVKVYAYEKGAPVLSIGNVQPPDNSKFVFDEGFQHESTIPESFAFSIKCKFKWVSCDTWPENIRSLCLRFSWPFHGYWAVDECEVGFIF